MQGILINTPNAGEKIITSSIFLIITLTYLHGVNIVVQKHSFNHTGFCVIPVYKIVEVVVHRNTGIKFKMTASRL